MPEPKNVESEHEHHSGLRAVAIFEGVKAMAGFLAGLGFFIRVGDPSGTVVLAIALRIQSALHLPEATFQFLENFDRGDQTLAGIVLFGYAGLHTVESVGLWKERAWAEWLVVITGGVYIPFELYGSLRHPGWTTIGLLVINVAVVAYLLSVLLETRSARRNDAFQRRHSELRPRRE